MGGFGYSFFILKLYWSSDFRNAQMAENVSISIVCLQVTFWLRTKRKWTSRKSLIKYRLKNWLRRRYAFLFTKCSKISYNLYFELINILPTLIIKPYFSVPNCQAIIKPKLHWRVSLLGRKRSWRKDDKRKLRRKSRRKPMPSRVNRYCKRLNISTTD